jgi:hypothetical protein
LQTPLEATKYCENRQLVQQVERKNANAQKMLHCRNPLSLKISSGTQLCHRSTVFQSPKFKKNSSLSKASRRISAEQKIVSNTVFCDIPPLNADVSEETCFFWVE